MSPKRTASADCLPSACNNSAPVTCDKRQRRIEEYQQQPFAITSNDDKMFGATPLNTSPTSGLGASTSSVQRVGSDCIRHGVAGHRHHVVRHQASRKQSSMHMSKAFRCTLPSGLRDDQVSNIRQWAYLHCAQSSIFRDDRGVVVLVGVKDEFRTAASNGRTIRTALGRLCIDVPLRGHWCILITLREAMSMCATDCGQSAAARGTPSASPAAARMEDDADDQDIRIATLH